MKSTSLLDQADNQGIAERVAQISVSTIKEIMLLASKVPDTVSLGLGLPSFETPAYVKEAVIKELRTNPEVGKYSFFTGLPSLREAVATKVNQETKLKPDPDTEILITAGCMEALQATTLTLVDRDDEVIIPSPCFPSHIEQVLLAEGKPVFVPLKEEQGWKLDLETLRQRINNKTKALIITNPTNPTGTVLTEDELRAIAKLALDRNLYLIADETYRYLVYDNQKLFPLGRIPELKEKLVVCSSFSKEYAMTGFRIGFLFGPEKIVRQIMKVHDATIVCAPMISQLAALAALKGPQEVVDQFRQELAGRCKVICNRLDQLAPAFTYVKPRGAYYVFPRFNLPGVTNSREATLRLLHEAKVVTVPGLAFGPNGEDHLRLSFCGRKEEINQAFDRISAWLKKQSTN